MEAHYESAGVSVGFFHEGTSRDARSGGTSQHHRKHQPPRNSCPHGFGDPLLAHTPNSGPIWGQVSVQPPSSIAQGWRHLVPLVSAAGGKRSKQNVNNCACVVVQGENVRQTHRAADLMDIPEIWRLRLSPKLLLEGEKGLQDACCPAIRANPAQAKKKKPPPAAASQAALGIGIRSPYKFWDVWQGRGAVRQDTSLPPSLLVGRCSKHQALSTPAVVGFGAFGGFGSLFGRPGPGRRGCPRRAGPGAAIPKPPGMLGARMRPRLLPGRTA